VKLPSGALGAGALAFTSRGLRDILPFPFPPFSFTCFFFFPFFDMAAEKGAELQQTTLTHKQRKAFLGTFSLTDFDLFIYNI
jgi:hypothetical protein